MAHYECLCETRFGFKRGCNLTIHTTHTQQLRVRKILVQMVNFQMVSWKKMVILSLEFFNISSFVSILLNQRATAPTFYFFSNPTELMITVHMHRLCIISVKEPCVSLPFPTFISMKNVLKRAYATDSNRLLSLNSQLLSHSAVGDTVSVQLSLMTHDHSHPWWCLPSSVVVLDLMSHCVLMMIYGGHFCSFRTYMLHFDRY